MTIIEATHILIEWLQKHDSFCMKENFKEMMPGYVSETLDADYAAVECALQFLENDGIVKNANIKGHHYFVLVKPFESLDRNVAFCYNTILILCAIGKQVAENMGNKEFILDPLNITEKDILMVLHMLLEAAKINVEDIKKQLD